MSKKAKFCSECGAPLGENDLFCPVCGAKVDDLDTDKPIFTNKKESSHKSRQKHTPSAQDTGKDKQNISDVGEENTLWSQSTFSSAVQWAIIWAFGWLPAGVFLSKFYDIKRALNPEFYTEYPRLWWSTLAGLTTTFILGALISGFIAGIVLHRIIHSKKYFSGLVGIASALAWALFWILLLGILIFDIKGTGMNDGILFTAMYMLSPVFAAAMSFFLLYFFKQKYNVHFTKKQSITLGLSWAGCALLGLILMSILGDIITEILRGGV